MSVLTERSTRWFRSAAAAFLLAVGQGSLFGQSLTGAVGLGYTWQHTVGSSDSYATQFNLHPGFNLDELSVQYRGPEGGPQALSLTAWGFGDAEPARRARLLFKPSGPWRIELDYSRRASFFGLADTDLSTTQESWELTRWKAKVSWDAGSTVRLSLAGGQGYRVGTVERPVFGLNDLYPLHVDLNDRMTEGSFRVETLSLPVHVAFEQSYTQYLRRDRFSPADSASLSPTNPNLFVGASTDRTDEQRVPTSRLTAAYQDGRVEIDGSFLYSHASLAATGFTSTAFAVGGGTLGRVEFVDNLVGSATQDSETGYLRVGVRLDSGWTVRLLGNLRDASTDGSLLGQQLFRVVNPAGGVTEVSGPVDDASLFETRDRSGRIELEKSIGAWSLWLGGFVGSRDVSWKLNVDASRLDVHRETAGGLAGLAVDLSGRLRANVEFEKGSFENYVFRTDPQTVDRLTGALSSDLGSGLHASVRGRYERAENPTDIAGLRHHLGSFGVGGSWDSVTGQTSVGLDLDLVDLTTNTGLILPSGASTVSVYDLALLTVSGHLRQRLDPFLFELSGTRVEDRGKSWPAKSWIAAARVTVRGPYKTEISGFVQYDSYHEKQGGRDNFEVTRYGLGIRRSFD